MPQGDEDFEQSMRSLRNMVGLACCLISGALIVLAYGDWLMFVALILLYWPFSIAMDLGSRRDWRGRARRTLGGMKLLLVVDLLVGGLVALGPVLIARSLALEIGPAALALVLFAALAALWLEPAWQGVSVVGALALFVFPLLSLMRDYLKWSNRKYVVTSWRVLQLDGVFNKEVLDSALEKVNASLR